MNRQKQIDIFHIYRLPACLAASPPPRLTVSLPPYLPASLPVLRPLTWALVSCAARNARTSSVSKSTANSVSSQLPCDAKVPKNDNRLIMVFAQNCIWR